MSRLSRTLLVAAAALLPVVAEGQSECPFPSPSRSTLAWTGGEAPGRVTGVLIDLRTEGPPQEAWTWLRPTRDSSSATVSELRDARGVQRFYQWMDTPPHATLVDSTGRFAIEHVPAGQYFVHVSAGGIGAVVQDTVTVGGSGLRLFIVLASLRPQHLCRGAAVPPPSNDAWY